MLLMEILLTAVSQQTLPTIRFQPSLAQLLTKRLHIHLIRLLNASNLILYDAGRPCYRRCDGSPNRSIES